MKKLYISDIEISTLYICSQNGGGVDEILRVVLYLPTVKNGLRRYTHYFRGLGKLNSYLRKIESKVGTKFKKWEGRINRYEYR